MSDNFSSAILVQPGGSARSDSVNTIVRVGSFLRPYAPKDVGAFSFEDTAVSVVYSTEGWVEETLVDPQLQADMERLFDLLDMKEISKRRGAPPLSGRAQLYFQFYETPTGLHFRAGRKHIEAEEMQGGQKYDVKKRVIRQLYNEYPEFQAAEKDCTQAAPQNGSPSTKPAKPQ